MSATAQGAQDPTLGESALAELAEIARQDAGDPEAAHIRADDVLCRLLESLGYLDVVEAWMKIPKWYA